MGPTNIVNVLQKLPKSAHPLSDPSKFVVDTWQQAGSSLSHPDVLVVCVHGEFTERESAVRGSRPRAQNLMFVAVPVAGRRSFDRTFILAPSKAESACARYL